MDTIELIRLTLEEIRRSSEMIESCKNNYVLVSKLKNNVTEYRANEIMDYVDIMENARISLRDTLNDLLKFQEAKDMLTGVDIALSKTAIELINEIKNESDFED